MMIWNGQGEKQRPTEPDRLTTLVVIALFVGTLLFWKYFS